MAPIRDCFLSICSLILSLAILPGCGGDGSDSAGGGAAPTQLRFAARINGQDARCGVRYSGVGRSSTAIQIQDLRFYVSSITLIRRDGAEVAVSLVEDGLWQLGDLALLDFEDATGLCAELGTPQLNNVVNFSVPDGDYVAVRFTLGVPFDQNHGDSTVAPAPLNLGTMQWNWQAGYKFARIDLINENPAPNNKWFFHLGSTGCQSSSNVSAPATECARPNRVDVLLRNFDPASSEIVLDIGRFLDASDLKVNTPQTAPGCMSAPTDPECEPVFKALGISLETGQSEVGCNECQEMFTVG